ncbi:MAG: glycosyltransferase family 4 protein [Patescibacteria group bacterium]
MSIKSRKILIFTTGYQPLVGGSELALENIIRRLPNIFFDILTPRHRRRLAVRENGQNFHLRRLGFGWSIDKFLFPVLAFWPALKLIRDGGYQTIHAYQASHAAGAAWLIKLFKPDFKFIVTLQEGKMLDKQNWLIKFFRRLILKKADIITAISNYLADYAKKINPRAQIVIIPNGVDIEKFQIPKSKYQTKFKLQNPKNKTIITVSRLVSKNGIGDLLEAFALVKEKTNEVKLVIIGNGPLRDSLEQKAKNLGFSEDILFLGEVPNQKLPDYLKLADVFVRPSLSEGLGTAFLEAMAAGLPIVATPVGGIPDFLKDGETGLFCQPREPSDIADKIVKLLSDEALRREISQQGRTLVEKNYNWQTIAIKFAEIYG